MITLSEAHVKELETFIQELPTKYGLPLIQFLNKAAAESAEKAAPKSKKKALAEDEDLIQD